MSEVIKLSSIEFNDRILFLMEIHSLTRNMFADRINVSQPTVSRWLNHNVVPRGDLFNRISKEFKIPVHVLRARSIENVSELKAYAAKYGFELVYTGPKEIPAKPAKTLNNSEIDYKKLWEEAKKEVQMLRRIIERGKK